MADFAPSRAPRLDSTGRAWQAWPMRRAIVIAACLPAAWLLAGPGTAALAEGDAARGEKLAVEQCKRCHVVGDHNFMGIDSNPSFRLFARRIERYEQRILTFQDRLPHPSRGFDFAPAQLEDLLAYIKTLAKPEKIGEDAFAAPRRERRRQRTRGR